MEPLPRWKPRELTPTQLTDLLIAWAEGEVSEGRMEELTGLDRVTLRGMKADAVERALAIAQLTPEEKADLDAWVQRAEARHATSAVPSSLETMTDPPSPSEPCPVEDTSSVSK